MKSLISTRVKKIDFLVAPMLRHPDKYFITKAARPERFIDWLETSMNLRQDEVI